LDKLQNTSTIYYRFYQYNSSKYLKLYVHPELLQQAFTPKDIPIRVFSASPSLNYDKAKSQVFPYFLEFGHIFRIDEDLPHHQSIQAPTHI